MLTPLEWILLNKKMPHEYKLETEENILKLFELSKKHPKRIKMSDVVVIIKNTKKFQKAQ